MRSITKIISMAFGHVALISWTVCPPKKCFTNLLTIADCGDQTNLLSNHAAIADAYLNHSLMSHVFTPYDST
ncbi:hypothetical protein BGW37DRAFT_486568 [Umbelopsis sp. PMI_123]|nr:hypothetical protein BGW37DRAFT_486568 [Umbelopsis sp. PMI_123]